MSDSEFSGPGGSPAADPSLSETMEVYGRCLCMRVQRAARALARHFDEALGPIGLTHGQFSVMTALNRPEAPTLSSVADLLGMDRTSLTAKLKALTKRGLVEVAVDAADRRSRRLSLTGEGRALLKVATPIWRAAHDALDARAPGVDQAGLKAALDALAGR